MLGLVTSPGCLDCTYLLSKHITADERYIVAQQLVDISEVSNSLCFCPIALFGIPSEGAIGLGKSKLGNLIAHFAKHLRCSEPFFGNQSSAMYYSTDPDLC